VVNMAVNPFPFTVMGDHIGHCGGETRFSH
jgi:hypothetical protein